jgi:hypothetical protein
MKKILNIIFLFLLVPSLCFAVDVYTKEGKKFVGIVTEETDQYVQLKTDEGTVIINTIDIVHIERGDVAEKKESQSFMEEVKKYYTKVSQNKWYYVRQQIKRAHGKLFVVLNKNRVYQLVTKIKAVDSFRIDNYKTYVFAVYMVLLLIVGMILSFIQKLLYALYCKMKGIKPRYDV